jgi:hypothetical protein
MAAHRNNISAHKMFAEKTFANGSETAKNAKVFSLESFPLYGIFLDGVGHCVHSTVMLHVIYNLTNITKVFFNMAAMTSDTSSQP